MPKMSFVCFCDGGEFISDTVEVHDFEAELQNIYRSRDELFLDISEPIYFTGSRYHLSDQKPSLAMVAPWDYFLVKWGWN